MSTGRMSDSRGSSVFTMLILTITLLLGHSSHIRALLLLDYLGITQHQSGVAQ
jgi:hypothetical protein